MNANARIRLATFAALGTVTLSSARAQQPPARWTLDAKPSITLGLDDSDPAALLQKIVSATRLPDGAILVGDLGDFALKRFSANGRLERSFARSGSGPGEVRYLGRMLRCGNSVFTYDIAEGHRMSVFALDGRYVRTFRFRGPPGQQTPYSSACNAAGDFVHLGWGAAREIKPGTHRPRVPVWTSRDGRASSRGMPTSRSRPRCLPTRIS